MTAAEPCCDRCLRRAVLLEACAGGIDIARRQRRPLREVLSLSDAALVAAVGGDRADGLRSAVRRRDLGGLRDLTERAGLGVLCRHNDAYPARLREDPAPPAALFVAAGGEPPADRLARLVGGSSDVPPPPVVAIVGTRRASADGIEVARTLARGLAAAGVTVVSGMALGIDSAAHAGALEAGGRTVAVLAGGADIAYPASKARLYDRILAAGAVVSEMPPGFRAFKWCFPARNRIIASLAQATIVVEAAERSGSLITAEMAMDLGRDVAAVPGPVTTWRSGGTNALLRDGATLIRDARDALDLLLGLDGAQAALRAIGDRAAPAPPELSDRLRALLEAIEDGRTTVDGLTGVAGSVADVRAGVMELELAGLVRRGPGGRLVRSGLDLGGLPSAPR